MCIKDSDFKEGKRENERDTRSSRGVDARESCEKRVKCFLSGKGRETTSLYWRLAITVRSSSEKSSTKIRTLE
jgi:hypothetical protein